MLHKLVFKGNISNIFNNDAQNEQLIITETRSFSQRTVVDRKMFFWKRAQKSENYSQYLWTSPLTRIMIYEQYSIHGKIAWECFFK